MRSPRTSTNRPRCPEARVRLRGQLTAASAGATVAGGGEVAAMQNQNGVVIKLRSTTQGLAFNLSVDGVSIKLKK